jgi:hypothetical protein
MKQVLLAISLFCIINLSAQKNKQINKQENKLVETIVLDLHQKKFDWMINKQYDSLLNIFDNQLIYIHSNGWIETKSDIITDLKSGKLNYLKVNVTEAKARIYKNTAIVNGSGVFNVMLEGKPIEINLIYTEVYINKKNKWQLASRHANKM